MKLTEQLADNMEMWEDVRAIEIVQHDILGDDDKPRWCQPYVRDLSRVSEDCAPFVSLDGAYFLFQRGREENEGRHWLLCDGAQQCNERSDGGSILASRYSDEKGDSPIAMDFVHYDGSGSLKNAAKHATSAGITVLDYTRTFDKRVAEGNEVKCVRVSCTKSDMMASTRENGVGVFRYNPGLSEQRQSPVFTRGVNGAHLFHDCRGRWCISNARADAIDGGLGAVFSSSREMKSLYRAL